MIELLAPAGDFECLKAAVLNGVSAVYIGGKEFSARQNAANFDRKEIIEAVKYCHAYNVKVYVTLNTLVANNELDEALEYSKFLYENGVDALIIQDIGFFKALKECIPDFEVHGSTQMTVHNIDGVNFLYNLGMKRIVLSRELSLNEIEFITKNTKAEIEVFAHGALCICFSGQCLMSSFLGGRSGNRGRCAQPCRMLYRIDESKRQYLLSPKDLCTYEFMDKLINAGVKSIKIEGRMKRPEYVAEVVSAYRRALYGYKNEQDMEDLTQIFNRGGFTSCFLFERQGKDMMSYERPKNWGTYLGVVSYVKGKFAGIKLSKELNVGDGVEIFGKDKGAPVGKIYINGKENERAYKGDIAEIYLEGAKKGDIIYKSSDIKLINKVKESLKENNSNKVPIEGVLNLKLNENAKLKVICRDESFEAIESQPEIALKKSLDEEKVKEFINKTGDTPFYFENIKIDMDEGVAFPVSKVNNLRRTAISGLSEQLQDKKRCMDINFNFNKKSSINPVKIAVKTGRLDIAKAAVDCGCDILFFGGDKLRINNGSMEEVFKYANKKVKVYPWYSEILIEEYEQVKKEAIEYKTMGMDKALCGNIGLYSYLLNNGIKVFIDKGFNIFNSYACESIENEGCLLSSELTINELKNTINNTNNNCMVKVYGREKLMVSRQCIFGSAFDGGKRKCNNLCENKLHNLVDDKGQNFILASDKFCRTHIYNSKITCALEEIYDVININPDYIVLDFTFEDSSFASNVICAFKDGVKNFYSNNKIMTENMKKVLYDMQSNITKGHFYKGVL